MPTSKDLQQLLERIQLRLDESFVGIGSEVAHLPPEDLAELLNQLNLAEAAAIVSMLPLVLCIELLDQPTMRRRAAILEQIEPARVAAILEGLSADERTSREKSRCDRGPTGHFAFRGEGHHRYVPACWRSFCRVKSDSAREPRRNVFGRRYVLSIS